MKCWNSVIDEVIAALHAERGFIMLHEARRPADFRVARGLDQTTIDQPQSQVSQSVVQKVAQEGQPILTSDAQTDTRFNMRQSVMLLGLRSVLCVPVKIKEKVLGVVYADNRFEAGIFTQADMDLLMAITAIAAIAIDNARLYQMAVEKGRLMRELQMAREMQTSFLPDSCPQVPAGSLQPAGCRPAKSPATITTSSRSTTQHLGLVIADVTDKGAAAALFMVFTNSIVRASVHPQLQPVESIINANRLICQKSPNAMFVSLVYCLLDTSSGQVTWSMPGTTRPCTTMPAPAAWSASTPPAWCWASSQIPPTSSASWPSSPATLSCSTPTACPMPLTPVKKPIHSSASNIPPPFHRAALPSRSCRTSKPTCSPTPAAWCPSMILPCWS
jgi:hypothetical protein